MLQTVLVIFGFLPEFSHSDIQCVFPNCHTHPCGVLILQTFPSLYLIVTFHLNFISRSQPVVLYVKLSFLHPLHLCALQKMKMCSLQVTFFFLNIILLNNVLRSQWDKVKERTCRLKSSSSCTKAVREHWLCYIWIQSLCTRPRSSSMKPQSYQLFHSAKEVKSLRDHRIKSYGSVSHRCHLWNRFLT